MFAAISKILSWLQSRLDTNSCFGAGVFFGPFYFFGYCYFGFFSVLVAAYAVYNICLEVVVENDLLINLSII